jgi:hypothetical protein
LKIDARNHHLAVRRLQKSQLLDDQKQEEEPGPAGAQEILLIVPQAYGPQGSEVTSSE